LAGIVNGISGQHQAFQTPVASAFWSGMASSPLRAYPRDVLQSARAILAADVHYQLIASQVYNRDRGPVSVIGTHLRTQF